jgi:hypothetical protein
MTVWLPAKKKRSKYNVRNDAQGKAMRTVDGILFDSAKEAKRYSELSLLQRAGEIHSFFYEKEDLVFLLYVNQQLVAKYEADFRYFAKGATRETVEDCKGFQTPVYKLKKKLMLAIHGIEIKEA